VSLRKDEAPATDRAVSRGRKVRQQPRPSKPHSPITQTFAVTDGREPVGVVELIANGFIAIDTHGKILGSFASLKAAAASFPQQDGGAQ